MFFQAITLATLISLALACSKNNCLNAFSHASVSAKLFCASYTQHTSTATTALPPYATQCSNIPSKISSACSCLFTAPPTSTKSSSTFSTVSTVAATCTPSTLKDTDFGAEISGGSQTLKSWQVVVNDAPNTLITQPETRFQAASTNFFEVDFPNSAVDPYLTTVTLSQGGVQVCDGTSTISYQYAATINAIAANPVPEINHCTITTGFTGISSSVQTNTVNWVTQPFPIPMLNYGFPVAGLGKAGVTTSFYVTIGCTSVDWWPEIHIMKPSVGTI